MKYTGNYNLKKPDGTDVVNIEDLNENADIIDAELKKLNDAIKDLDADGITLPDGKTISEKFEEITEEVGNIQELNTDEKANIVAAINEIYQALLTHQQNTNQEIGQVASDLAAHKAAIASTTTRGHVQLSSAVNSTREDLAATPRAVKMAYDKANEKPFVVGTYTGNDSPSRTISLGFRPSAVFVVPQNNEQNNEFHYYGGLAIDGYPVKTDNGDYVVSIASNGFTVYYDRSKSIYTNYNGIGLNPFRYIAFK